MKDPTTKHQDPEKFQDPNSHFAREQLVGFGASLLPGGWRLLLSFTVELQHFAHCQPSQLAILDSGRVFE